MEISFDIGTTPSPLTKDVISKGVMMPKRFELQMVEVIVVRSNVEHLLYPVAGVEPVTQ